MNARVPKRFDWVIFIKHTRPQGVGPHATRFDAVVEEDAAMVTGVAENGELSLVVFPSGGNYESAVVENGPGCVVGEAEFTSGCRPETEVRELGVGDIELGVWRWPETLRPGQPTYTSSTGTFTPHPLARPAPSEVVVEMRPKRQPPIAAHYDGLIQDLVNALTAVRSDYLDGGRVSGRAQTDAETALQTAEMLGWSARKL